jgi:DNA-binding NarL/FixJ family response regulator
MSLSYLFSALALIVSVVSFFYLRFYIKKRTSTDMIASDVREEVQRIIDEIDRVTDRDSELVEERVRQFNAGMEQRTSQLNAVLDEADRRIGVLSREVDVHVRREDAYAERGRQRAESREQRTENREQRAGGGGLSNRERVLLMSARGVSSAQIAAKLGITITEVEMAVFMQKQNG